MKGQNNQKRLKERRKQTLGIDKRAHKIATTDYQPVRSTQQQESQIQQYEQIFQNLDEKLNDPTQVSYAAQNADTHEDEASDLLLKVFHQDEKDEGNKLGEEK